MFSFSSDKYPEMELLEYMVLFIFEEPPYCFPQWQYQSAFPTNSTQGFPFFHLLTNTCWVVFFFLFFSFLFFFFFCFLLFRATLMAYGSSQASDQIRAAAASLRHSHISARSKLCLQTTPQFTATPDLKPTG